jgi:hypothetical protein
LGIDTAENSMHTITNTLASCRLLFLLAMAVQATASAECKNSKSCPDPNQPKELAQALTGYREAVVLGEFEEAEILAKRAVELSIAVNGRGSVHTANALTNLAFVQYKQQQFEPARLNLRAAIQTIEEGGDYLSADLIRPLHRLGQLELELGEVQSATESFQRAVHISHVHSGPQNTDQIESLEAIAGIYLDSGNIKEARDTQRRILGYRARADGADSEAHLPALEHYADWMHKLQLYNRERNTYHEILEIQERHHGPNDPRIIPTLIRMAFLLHDVSMSTLDDNSFRRMRSPDYYLGRAMKIAAGSSDSDLFAETALTIGDYYTMAQRFGRARSAYKDAWKQFSSGPSELARRNEEMESPKLLAAPRLPEYYDDQDPLHEPVTNDDFIRGTIVAKFDVTRTGETVRIRLIESQPPGLDKIEKRLVRNLRSLMYRPRMQDGATMDTQQLTYTYEFFYRDGAEQE